MKKFKQGAITLIWFFLAVSISACQGGFNGINIGVWGGSGGGSGVGVGMGFPIGGRAEQTQKVELPKDLPFVVGELVAENDLYYRRFLGLTPKGSYVVQDFYKVVDATINARMELKLTDAYVVQTLQSVQDSLLTESVRTDNALNAKALQWFENLDADGTVMVWFMSGNKAVLANYKMGLLHGDWLQWYENGGEEVKGVYTTGERTGRWRYRDVQGKTTEKVN